MHLRRTSISAPWTRAVSDTRRWLVHLGDQAHEHEVGVPRVSELVPVVGRDVDYILGVDLLVLALVPHHPESRYHVYLVLEIMLVIGCVASLLHREPTHLEIRDPVGPLEEPLDPMNQHRYSELLERATVPISAGENFLIPPGTAFKSEREWGLSLNETDLALDIVQPAVAKNCCFEDAVRFMSIVEKTGMKLYPHFLGSAPGMATTAHLASLSEEPVLEWDINPNPMRTSLFSEPWTIENGYLNLNNLPGIGWEINRGILGKWAVNHVEVTV